MVFTNRIYNKMIEKKECDLCGMILPNEPPRLAKHTEFHCTAQVQGRNTTQGYPKWKTVI